MESRKLIKLGLAKELIGLANGVFAPQGAIVTDLKRMHTEWTKTIKTNTLKSVLWSKSGLNFINGLGQSHVRLDGWSGSIYSYFRNSVVRGKSVKQVEAPIRAIFRLYHPVYFVSDLGEKYSTFVKSPVKGISARIDNAVAKQYLDHFNKFSQKLNARDPSRVTVDFSEINPADGMLAGLLSARHKALSAALTALAPFIQDVSVVLRIEEAAYQTGKALCSNLLEICDKIELERDQ